MQKITAWVKLIRKDGREVPDDVRLTEEDVMEALRQLMRTHVDVYGLSEDDYQWYVDAVDNS